MNLGIAPKGPPAVATGPPVVPKSVPAPGRGAPIIVPVGQEIMHREGYREVNARTMRRKDNYRLLALLLHWGDMLRGFPDTLMFPLDLCVLSDEGTGVVGLRYSYPTVGAKNLVDNVLLKNRGTPSKVAPFTEYHGSKFLEKILCLYRAMHAVEIYGFPLDTDSVRAVRIGNLRPGEKYPFVATTAVGETTETSHKGLGSGDTRNQTTFAFVVAAGWSAITVGDRPVVQTTVDPDAVTDLFTIARVYKEIFGDGARAKWVASVLADIESSSVRTVDQAIQVAVDACVGETHAYLLPSFPETRDLPEIRKTGKLTGRLDATLEKIREEIGEVEGGQDGDATRCRLASLACACLYATEDQPASAYMKELAKKREDVMRVYSLSP